jgi:hypothetical protein
MMHISSWQSYLIFIEVGPERKGQGLPPEHDCANFHSLSPFPTLYLPLQNWKMTKGFT